MRLNKYLSMCGITSRRKSDVLIEEGRVKVNGQVVALGYEVLENDVVTLDDVEVRPVEKKYYFVLNKPLGCVTTLKDDRGRKTVIDVFNEAFKAYAGLKEGQEAPKVFPVGRLDYNTSGLLILTNDGDFANALMHPRAHVEKVYNALVFPKINKKEIEKLERGVKINGTKTLPAKLNVLKHYDKVDLVQVTITQGMNRQIRKMFDSVNKRVDELRRVAIGSVKLGDLPCGKIKELTPEEVASLVKISNENERNL